MEVSIQNSEEVSESKLPKGCIKDFHPQRQRFDFDELSIDTLFDSANLASAVKVKEFNYHLNIAPDAYLTASQTQSRTWFYFRVTNVQKKGNYTFTVKNMNRQVNLLESGLTPVFKTIPSSPEWKPINPQTILLRSLEKNLEVTFSQTLDPTDKEVFIAYTYPWSYTDDQENLNKIETQFKADDSIYFSREVLTYSREARRIELLTITSHANKLEQREEILPNLFPHYLENPRPFRFENKQYVFISARVHPGETPASFTFNGLLRFLLDKNDPRSIAFRDNFVAVLVPMLNPDGVSRGHYRMDTYGLNLNRFYISPTIEQHPSIYAVKEVMMNLHNRGLLYLYCDLHAHANLKGCFVYGNTLEFRDQVEANLFPKLLSLNSQHFEYDKCNFSEKNTGGDKSDKEKEGAGRVAIYQATNNPRCYTLECSYAAGKIRNILSPIDPIQTGSVPKIEGVKLGDFKGDRRDCLDPYTSENFEEIGEGIGPALLDMIEKNPLSRISNTPYQTLSNVKVHIGLNLMKELRFRLDPFVKKVNKNLEGNIENLKTFIEQGIQMNLSAKSKSTGEIKKKFGAKKGKKEDKNKENKFQLLEDSSVAQKDNHSNDTQKSENTSKEENRIIAEESSNNINEAN